MSILTKKLSNFSNPQSKHKIFIFRIVILLKNLIQKLEGFKLNIFDDNFSTIRVLKETGSLVLII